VYKLYGNSVLNDDAFMTIVGSFAFIFGAIRFVWSWLVDLYSYKFSYTIILAVQSFLALTLVAISEIKICYFFWVCLLIWLEGGHFVLLPTIMAKIFPETRAQIYSIAFSLNGMANLLAIILIRYFLVYVGFAFFFYVGGVFSIISLLLLVFLFKEEPVVIKKGK
jgi:MFS family permease